MLLINLVSTWIAFSSLIQNRKKRKKQLTFLNPKVTWKFGSDTFSVGFKLEKRLTKWAPGILCMEEASARGRTFYGKISDRSTAAKEDKQTRAGEDEGALRPITYGWERVLPVLSTQGVTSYSHIIREYNLPYFFFFLHRLPSILHKMSQTARLLFWECWIL